MSLLTTFTSVDADVIECINLCSDSEDEEGISPTLGPEISRSTVFEARAAEVTPSLSYFDIVSWNNLT